MIDPNQIDELHLIGLLVTDVAAPQFQPADFHCACRVRKCQDWALCMQPAQAEKSLFGYLGRLIGQWTELQMNFKSHTALWELSSTWNTGRVHTL